MTTSKVVVVGTGDKAHGIANMFECNATKNEDYEIVFTEPLRTRSANTAPIFQQASAKIESFPEALEDADIVILAIPSNALQPFLVKNFSIFKDECVVVDATNAMTHKQDLKWALSTLEIVDFNRWVKAFNDCGAIQELQYIASDKDRLTTNICGPNKNAVNAVVNFAEAIGFQTKTVPYDQFERIRSSQDTLGWEWIHATMFMVVLFILVAIYVVSNFFQLLY